MIIEFQRKIYTIPEPYPYPSEKIIHPEKSISFPISQNSSGSRFQYTHRLAKIIFFLLREGPRLTWSKVRAVSLQNKIITESKVILAYGRMKDEDRYAIAVGLQDCPRSEYLKFPGSFTMEVPEDANIHEYYEILLGFFNEKPQILDEMNHYSPYSGLGKSLDLKEVINHPLSKVPHSMSGELEAVTLKLNSSKNIASEHNPIVQPNKDVELFLAGAGAYACAYILPALRKVRHHTVIDLNPGLACVVGEEYGFIYRDTSCERGLKRLQDCMHPLLVIATYHSTHLEIADQALSYNPATKIFLEKPPVTTREQLHRLLDLRKKEAFIEIGYNRRYSPFVRKAKDLVEQQTGPISMTCMIKELMIPKTHWYYWPTQGTRITGNLCHWIDLGCYFIKQKPVSVTVVSPPGGLPGDELSLIVLFEDGSRLTLIATDRGNPLRGVQEYIDVRRDDLTITIDDFTKMKVQKGGQERVYRRIIRDKGHLRMYKEFLKNATEEQAPLYPDDDLYISTTLYLSITEMVLQGQKNLDIQLT